jgi:hypothetical protein
MENIFLFLDNNNSYIQIIKKILNIILKYLTNLTNFASINNDNNNNNDNYNENDIVKIKMNFIYNININQTLLIFLITISIAIIINMIMKLIIIKKTTTRNLENLEKIKQKNLLEKLNIEINYQYIDTISGLEEIKSKIKKEKITQIGIDTEYSKNFNNKKKNKEINNNKNLGHLCLIQISLKNLNGKKFIYIIDLLKFEKIQIKENLENILNDINIEKIIHSSYNDCEWIFDDFGIFVKNIFDTQEFYSYLSGEEKRVGLNFLLKKYSGINLDKETKKNYQTSDWNKRPLDINQLQYSAIDTFFLIDLREKIYEDFEKKFILVGKDNDNYNDNKDVINNNNTNNNNISINKINFLSNLYYNKKSQRKLIMKIKEELDKKFYNNNNNYENKNTDISKDIKKDNLIKENISIRNYDYYLLEDFNKEFHLINKKDNIEKKKNTNINLEKYKYLFNSIIILLYNIYNILSNLKSYIINILYLFYYLIT